MWFCLIWYGLVMLVISFWCCKKQMCKQQSRLNHIFLKFFYIIYLNKIHNYHLKHITNISLSEKMNVKNWMQLSQVSKLFLVPNLNLSTKPNLYIGNGIFDASIDFLILSNSSPVQVSRTSFNFSSILAFEETTYAKTVV